MQNGCRNRPSCGVAKEVRVAHRLSAANASPCSRVASCRLTIHVALQVHRTCRKHSCRVFHELCLPSGSTTETCAPRSPKLLAPQPLQCYHIAQLPARVHVCPIGGCWCSLLQLRNAVRCLACLPLGTRIINVSSNQYATQEDNIPRTYRMQAVKLPSQC